MPLHPYFQSTPIWQRDLPAALAEAQATDRRVFLLVARADCGGSRTLVEKTIAKEESYEYLVERFVCVARDADELTAEERALVARMRLSERTPFCLYLDGAGKLAFESAGGRPAAVFLNDLMEGATRRV